MDARNRTHAAGRYGVIRGEHLAVLAVCVALAAWNAGAVNWWRAVAAFWVIDLVGDLHDLTRKLPGVPPGTTELCNAEAIERSGPGAWRTCTSASRRSSWPTGRASRRVGSSTGPPAGSAATGGSFTRPTRRRRTR